MKKIDVIIPSYKPGKKLELLIERLQRQSIPPQHIIVINTEEQFWNRELEKKYNNLQVVHLKKEEFDHGGARDRGARMSDADILVFMTQDAFPADLELLKNLTAALEQKNVVSAYARQLPAEDCRFIERYTRGFNYPEKSMVKWKEHLPEMGIKTYFCSNVCAAYDRKTYLKLGGFYQPAIFNEDMIYAATVIQAGYGIAYRADAKVIHSHNYSGWQQLRRNFDMGVSQAQHKEIFAGIPSEGEGIRLVKRTASYLMEQKRYWMLIPLVWQSGCKYLGYLLGSRYEHLPHWLVIKLTDSPSYWKAFHPFFKD